MPPASAPTTGPGGGPPRPVSGHRFAVALACGLLCSPVALTTLLTSVLRSQEWLHLPAPLDGPGRIALWYALIAFFVMSRAWVGQRRVHWHWPVIGILACGSVCASRAASLSIFLPLVVPAWLLALYLCVFHLRRGAGEGTQPGQEPAAV